MELRDDLALAMQPSRLMDALVGTADPWQRATLDRQWHRLLLLCHRQSGKSTTVAAGVYHTMHYESDTLQVLLAPSQRQSSELMRKVKEARRAHPHPLHVVEDAATTLTLANGSRCVALPGTEKTVRGLSRVRRLIVDEAAQVPDTLFFAVRPMLLMSSGDLWLLSTPYGKRGHFFDLWSGSGDEWERIKVTALDNPRVPTDFLETERRDMPQSFFEQEYLCEFREAEDQVFRHEDVLRAFGGANDSEALFTRSVPEVASVPDHATLGPLFVDAPGVAA